MRSRLAAFVPLAVVCLAAFPPDLCVGRRNPHDGSCGPQGRRSAREPAHGGERRTRRGRAVGAGEKPPSVGISNLDPSDDRCDGAGRRGEALHLQVGEDHHHDGHQHDRPYPGSAAAFHQEISRTRHGQSGERHARGLRGCEGCRGSLPGFEPKQVVCQYSFGVKKEGSGGISFEILPVSVSGDATASKQAVQTVSLSFKQR